MAVITGGARGQGRSHAVELARLGADIAVCDLCDDLGTVTYPLATPDDLAETVRLVEAEGRRCVSAVADVRDLDAMIAFVDGVRRRAGFGRHPGGQRRDLSLGRSARMDAAEWSETIDTNLTGVFDAMRAAAPHMRRQRWGRIIGISSMMGRSVQPRDPGLLASKWGVIGLSKSVALELANSPSPSTPSPRATSHTDGAQRHALPDHASGSRASDPRRRGPGHGHPPRAAGSRGSSPRRSPRPWCSSLPRRPGTYPGSVIDVDAGASARFTRGWPPSGLTLFFTFGTWPPGPQLRPGPFGGHRAPVVSPA